MNEINKQYRHPPVKLTSHEIEARKLWADLVAWNKQPWVKRIAENLLQDAKHPALKEPKRLE